MSKIPFGSLFFLFLTLASLITCNTEASSVSPNQASPQPQSASNVQPAIGANRLPKPEGTTDAQQKTESQDPKAKVQERQAAEKSQQNQALKITINENAKNIETQPEPKIEVGEVLSSENGEEISFKVDPLSENVIEKEEQQLQKQQIKDQEAKLYPWVAEQFENFEQADSIQTHQIFSFQIAEESQFKWNPTQFKSGPLKFVVEVFNYARGDITFPENPQEDDFVQILTKSETSTSYTNLGKVYLKKLFTINFFSDYQIIKIVNHYDKKMLVQISLEATKFVPEKALDDDTLKIPAEKIKGILDQLEETEMKREKTYRSEWSFRDRQEHHQSQMLILTGVELIVILGTAIVQMYCIKNLFDNRLIV